MNGLKPVTDAKINSNDVPFVVDSGAFFSMLSPSAAAEFKLPLRPAPFGMVVTGLGGAMESAEVTSATLTLAGITFPRKFDFIVGGNEVGGGARGLLGQNILSVADVEYDLANGVVRLIKPEGSCRKIRPIYWAKEGDAYSEMEINSATPQQPHTTGSGMINGSKVTVMFDTGSWASFVSLRAAARAGVKPDGPGVIPAGTSYGVGQGYVQTWIAPFQSFRIGSEEIRNTHLRIGDLRLQITDMVIGADFFLSHRIYVASSERKLYFTYNGGPIFNLTTRPVTPDTTAQNAPAPANMSAPPTAENPDDTSAPPAAGAAAAKDTKIPGGQPTNAEEFYRRGAAYLSRRDYPHALADLQRACELNPQEPKYFFERASVYYFTQQNELLDADLDTTLKLKPDDINALFWRAQRKLAKHDKTGAIADLDAADHAAAPQANVRLPLGREYEGAGELPPAIKQYDLWIDAHGEDIDLASAYTSRCGARALMGQELDQALADCNKALRRRSDYSNALTDRGLVYLRLGKSDRAISDYSAALKQQPKNAWALYGRGLAETQLKKTADAEADINAATALAPHIREEFTKRGIAP
jgi:tetratricopeptide (TPR) repeat protein/predicted aspartyl protease